MDMTLAMEREMKEKKRKQLKLLQYSDDRLEHKEPFKEMAQSSSY